jgi:prophage antirepressor-like protein
MSFVNFEGIDFTYICDENGDPWFIAKELCNYLDIKHTGRACKHIPDCNKQYMIFEHLKTTGKGSGRGGDNGRRLIVNEPGAYQLIFQSKRPEATKLQQWLYSDVMPALRKHGEYKMQEKITQAPPSARYIESVPENFQEALLLAASIEGARMELAHENIELKKEVSEKTHGLRVAAKTVEQATKTVKRISWKAEGYDKFQNYTGEYTLNAAAKIFGMKPHTFTAKLREHHILYLMHGKNIPYQQYVERGWFVVKEVQGRSDRDTKTYFQTFVTPKGLRGLWRKFGPQQDKLF